MRTSLMLSAPLAAVLMLSGAAVAQWFNPGGGLAGTTGVPMVLTGIGAQKVATVNQVAVAGGLALSPGFLVVGHAKLGVPFKGGLMIPFPDTVVMFGFDGLGGFKVSFNWPAGIPAGTNLWWQVWMSDPGGPKGWAASNGMLSVSS